MSMLRHSHRYPAITRGDAVDHHLSIIVVCSHISPEAVARRRPRLHCRRADRATDA